MKDGHWIAVDLDGTIAEYHGYQGHAHIGVPIWPMVDRVRQWTKEGKEVRIFTTRVCETSHSVNDIVAARLAIKQWCRDHVGVELRVTAQKDRGMSALFDDRAVNVERNTGFISQTKFSVNLEVEL